MKQILITGGAGFVGSYLCNAFKAVGYDVVAVDDLSNGIESNIKPGIHPIVPIMLGDAKLAQDMAIDMLDENIYVIGFSLPIVPRGEARIRVQLSAAHTKVHQDKAVDAFVKIGEKYKILN